VQCEWSSAATYVISDGERVRELRHDRTSCEVSWGGFDLYYETRVSKVILVFVNELRNELFQNIFLG